MVHESLMTSFDLDAPVPTLTSLNIASTNLVELKDTIFDFMPNLQNTRASIQKSGGGSFQRDVASIERFRIENRVDPGKPHG